MPQRFTPGPKGAKFQSRPAGKNPTTPRRVKQASHPGSLDTRPRATVKKAHSQPVVENTRAPRGDFKAKPVKHERVPQEPLSSMSRWQK